MRIGLFAIALAAVLAGCGNSQRAGTEPNANASTGDRARTPRTDERENVNSPYTGPAVNRAGQAITGDRKNLPRTSGVTRSGSAQGRNAQDNARGSEIQSGTADKPGQGGKR